MTEITVELIVLGSLRRIDTLHREVKTPIIPLGFGWEAVKYKTNKKLLILI